MGNNSYSELLEKLEKIIPNEIAQLRNMVAAIESSADTIINRHLPFQYWRLDKPGQTFVSDESFSLEYCSMIAEVIITNKFNINSRAELQRILKTPDKDLQGWRGKITDFFIID